MVSDQYQTWWSHTGPGRALNPQGAVGCAAAAAPSRGEEGTGGEAHLLPHLKQQRRWRLLISDSAPRRSGPGSQEAASSRRPFPAAASATPRRRRRRQLCLLSQAARRELGWLNNSLGGANEGSTPATSTAAQRCVGEMKQKAAFYTLLPFDVTDPHFAIKNKKILSVLKMKLEFISINH